MTGAISTQFTGMVGRRLTSTLYSDKPPTVVESRDLITFADARMPPEGRNPSAKRDTDSVRILQDD